MPIDSAHIAALLRAWSDHTATDAQRQELLDWVAQTSDAGPFETHLQQLLSQYPDDFRIPGVDWEKIYDRITAESGMAIPISGGYQKIVHQRRLYQKWAAAAAIFILLAAGAWIWLNHSSQKHPDVAVISTHNDLAPGGNKAILTLASGQKIILDSARNGDLAQQSGTTIIKSDSGQITYQANNQNAAANTHNTSSNAQNTASASYNTLTTPRGGQYELVLPDGSRVWLNAASSITYPTAFTGTERTVTITGEAYFEVAKNAGKPFRVKAGAQTIEVLGTSFNINTYPDEPEQITTLLEGSIKCTTPQGNLILKPGQQAECKPAGQLNMMAHADPEQVLAWKNGLFKFKGTNIREIMRQVSRWYDVDVEFAGNTEDLAFGGIVSRKAHVSELLTLLQTTGTVHFTIEGKKIIVAP